MLTKTDNSPNAIVSPLHWNDVSWRNGFWADAEENNTLHTIPHLQSMFESKDISHVLENFRICAGEVSGSFDGTVFGDGDFYKWMEAAIYSAAKSKDTSLLKKIDEYITLIGKAQLADGYISTKQIIGERENSGIKRGGDINDFEVYNFGHLFTAACLHYRLTDKDNFLKIAEKAAAYLKKLYRKSQISGDIQTAVCPSHYMGLLELYRTTGNGEYLDLAKLALSLRDSVENGLDDNQDRLPVKEHTEIIGHAVRANYLYAGVADLCLELADTSYQEVLNKVWNNLINQKLYLIGGCGALYNGASPYGDFFTHQLVHQAYGYDYQLPNITAYNETCASVGFVLWAYRMFLRTPKAEYFDYIERAMLNVNLAAVSLDGQKYFYENMLRRTKDLTVKLVWPLKRSEYILSYCCPPNLARAIAESSEYAYLISENTLWLGMYGSNQASVHLPSGTSFDIRSETGYPYDGRITLTITNKKGDDFHLNIRIPSWASSGNVEAKSKKCTLTREDSGTYLTWDVKDSDFVDNTYRVVVEFDMDARLTIAHSKVEEASNQAAVERGPLVYCMEGTDIDTDTLERIYLDPDSKLEPKEMMIKGRPITALEGYGLEIQRNEYDEEQLYQPLSPVSFHKKKIRMIPYFAWDNREYGEMRVWLPLLYHL